MHEDAETDNDRPFSLKRDRKQSVTFQGLLKREPVTKSPFKQRERVSSMDDPPPSPPHIPGVRHPSRSPVPIPSIASRLTPVDNVTPTSANGLSPGRSSLVPKRPNGPRLSGGAKRGRRKTVTFDERCDVLEFDRDTSDEEYWDDSDDEAGHSQAYQDNDEVDPFFCGGHAVDEPQISDLDPHLAHDASMEELPHESTPTTDLSNSPAAATLLNTDTSINGLVEEIFFSSNAALIDADLSGSKTPPHVSDIPSDLEMEDGVPFSRSHHAEHLLQFHQSSPQQNQPPPQFSPHAHSQTTNNSSRSPANRNSLSSNHTESPAFSSSRRASIALFRDDSEPMQSTPPPGRSTNIEEIIRSPKEETEKIDDPETHVEQLPMSPTPMKAMGSSTGHSEGFIPKFRWPRGEFFFQLAVIACLVL
jgi:hypothetical protein